MCHGSIEGQLEGQAVRRETSLKHLTQTANLGGKWAS